MWTIFTYLPAQKQREKITATRNTAIRTQVNVEFFKSRSYRNKNLENIPEHRHAGTGTFFQKKKKLL
jgi:hypothetical protein